jgi:hypothetical protein
MVGSVDNRRDCTVDIVGIVVAVGTIIIVGVIVTVGTFVAVRIVVAFGTVVFVVGSVVADAESYCFHIISPYNLQYIT